MMGYDSTFSSVLNNNILGFAFFFVLKIYYIASWKKCKQFVNPARKLPWFYADKARQGPKYIILVSII